MELSKTKTSLYSSLSSKKMRQKHRLFLAEGEKCALDTLGAFPLECLVASKEWLDGNRRLVSDYSDCVAVASADAIKKITTLVSPPEVIAVFRLPEENDKGVEIKEGKLYLMLDGVQDPGNLGTIIRTADWFGIDTIIASRDTSDVFNPKVVQSTMGSLKRVRMVYADLDEVLGQNPGVPVYGLLLDGESIYRSEYNREGGFIVMGNEGNGITPAIRKLITHKLLIPPYDKDRHPESLNVAVATAITLSWFRKPHPSPPLRGGS